MDKPAERKLYCVFRSVKAGLPPTQTENRIGETEYHELHKSIETGQNQRACESILGKADFVPRAGEDGGDPKYGVTLLIDKSNAEQMAFLKQIHQDAKEALEEAWSDVATRPRIPIIGDTYSIIKDGDKTTDKNGVPYKEKNPEYVGHYFIRTANKNRPAVVDRNRQEILDPEKIYSGCMCKVNLNVYSYQGKTSKGITCGLNGVQFWADGERIGGGRPSLESMFDAVPPVAGGADPFAGAPTPVEEDPFLKM